MTKRFSLPPKFEKEFMKVIHKRGWTLAKGITEALKLFIIVDGYFWDEGDK